MSRPVSDALVDHQRRAARIGVTYGLGAYLWWGLVPVYFKAVVRVPALEVLAHRIVWSVLLLTGLLVVQRRWALVGAVMKSRVTAVTLAGTTVLIAVNWFVFIWAVANDQVLQASLGYYVNPLVNVLLGYAFLGERLRRWQGLSVALAAVGVGYMAYGYGQIPWISLILAGSFGLYGLLRKTAKVGALVGLMVETTLLVPLALGYLVYLAVAGLGTLGTASLRMDGLLVLAGVVTAVPLLWFANAARRLRLATLGFLQYVAPTGHFVLAVAAYGEPFTRAQGITFACIWTALAIYSIGTVRAART
ncbi:MAG: EamA family transporter RarD [Planctomycetota bacterium]|jgi:chloramphenicol-sensitive protein RarD